MNANSKQSIKHLSSINKKNNKHMTIIQATKTKIEILLIVYRKE